MVDCEETYMLACQPACLPGSLTVQTKVVDCHESQTKFESFVRGLLSKDCNYHGNCKLRSTVTLQSQ